MAWVPAITAGIGLVSSYMGSKSADRRASRDRAQSTRLMNEQARQADQSRADYLGITGKYLDPAAKYWQTLLNGDRKALDTALAPEISQINAANAQAKREAVEFAPRGGLTASMMANMPFQQAAQVNNLYTSARPAAAQQLASLGGVAGQLAMGQSQAASSALAGASGTYSNLLNYLGGQYGAYAQQSNSSAVFGDQLSRFIDALQTAYQGRAPAATATTTAPTPVYPTWVPPAPTTSVPRSSPAPR